MKTKRTLQLFKLIAFMLLISSIKSTGQTGITYYRDSLNTVNCFAADDSGYVWIGGNNGLQKTDGTKWILYNTTNSNIPKGGIRSIDVDKSTGCIWFIGGSGLCKFDGTNFTSYLDPGNILKKKYVVVLKCVNGRIWVGVNDNLLSFDGTNWIDYSKTTIGYPKNVNCIESLNKDTVFVGSDSGLYRYDGINWNIIFPVAGMSFAGAPNLKINSVQYDKDYRLWVASSNNYYFGGFDSGVYYIENGKIHTVRDFYKNTCKRKLGTEYIKCFFRGKDGYINAVIDGAIIEYCKGSPQITFFADRNTIKNNIISALATTDKFGKIWLNMSYWYNKDSIGCLDLSKYTIGNLFPYNNPIRYAHLNANKVDAGIMNRGDMFENGVNGIMNSYWIDQSYEVPKGSCKHAIFVSALWIGGQDSKKNLHIAAMTYRQNGSDFFPGPLDTTTGKCDSITSSNYDKIWSITAYMIEQFKKAFIAGNVSNGSYSIPNEILTWPAHGKGNFSRNLAPFVDIDGDGVYNPMKGDYPKIRGDQMVYWIFNDNTFWHRETNGTPLGVEVHGSAYSYVCDSIPDTAINAALNYTTYYHYDIFNRSSNIYDSSVLGLFTDPDLGNYKDDFVGCDSLKNIGYVYNGDIIDEGENGYGKYPPMLSIQILNGPLADSADNIDNNHNGKIDEAGETIGLSGFTYYNNDFNRVNGNPEEADDYYYYMTARWKEGSFIRNDGKNGAGYGGRTNYMFSGNPGLNKGWTESSAGDLPGDRRFVMSCGTFTFKPGTHTSLDYAIVYSRADSSSNWLRSCFDKNYQYLDKTKLWFDNNSYPNCISTNSGIEENNEPIKLRIYPNPAKNYIQIDGLLLPVSYQIYDMQGRVILSGYTSKNIDLSSHLSPGMYILKLIQNQEVNLMKFIKE